MAALPTQGQSPGTWAQQIQDYLYVAHRADGQLKSGTANQYQALFADNAGGVGWQYPAMSYYGSITVAGTTTSQVTFASIPTLSQHLLLRYFGRQDAAATWQGIFLAFSGDDNNASAGNYTSSHVLLSDGENLGTTTTAAGDYGLGVGRCGLMPGAQAPANYPGGGEVLIPSYLDTIFHKTWNFRASAVIGTIAGSIYTDLGGGIWTPATPAAITSLSLQAGKAGTDHFVAGSQFHLYGFF